MADVTKNSYSEINNHSKVIFQRGRPVVDFELNELQDNLRVQQYRSLKEGTSVLSTQVAGSNDNGFKVTGTGASNAVTVEAGFIFLGGIPIRRASSGTLSGFTNADGSNPRIDVVYVSLAETEVADPAEVPELGETTKRLKLVATLGIVTGVAGASPVAPAIPADSLAEVWEGGTKYFKLAEVTRPTATNTIAAGNVVDFRARLPPYVVNQITKTINGVITGNWITSVGDGVNSFGDFDGATSIASIVTFLNAVYPSGWQATIHLKSGSYQNAGSVTIPSDCQLTIIGNSPSLSTDDLPCVINTPAAPFDTAATFFVSGKLRLKNVTLKGGSNPSLFSVVVVQDNGSAYFDDCFCENFALASTRAKEIIFNRCEIRGITTAPALQFTPSLSLNTGEYVALSDCVIVGAVDQAIGEFTPGTSGGALGHVWFIRCRITTGGVSSGGVTPSNNPGVFSIQGWSTNPPVGISGLHWINCDVTALTVSGGSAILAYMATGTISDRNTAVQLIEIDGGNWLIDCSVSNSTNSTPFYIGHGVWGGASADESIVEVRLKNLVTGYNSSGTPALYGGAPSDLVYSGGAWAAWTVRGHIVHVNNLRFKRLIKASTSCDFAVVGKISVDVNHVILNDHPIAGSGTAPVHRVVMYHVLQERNKAVWTNVLFDGNSTGDYTTVSANNGIFSDRLHPSGDTQTYTQMVLDRCSIMHVTTGTQKGFVISPQASQLRRIKLNNCVFRAIGDDGIYLAAGPLPRALHIKNCEVCGCSGLGIDINTTSNWGPADVQITGCLITENSDVGIRVKITGALFNTKRGPLIANNTVFDNGATNQIELGTTSVDETSGMIIGNSCHGSTIASGKISVLSSSIIWVCGIDANGVDVVQGQTLAATAANGTGLRHNQAIWQKT